ncbi:hypothetical protein [Roseicyclus persicicus]|uniref:Uncharacterized protein n=1 Tax=Roseicyclus persicicus TaxID=2650661 RepID=A0A7X6H2E5_9RHOB|nr:hypothetical protein [Roseibacterium persicicum]NKX45923.1 hypothetical protein [Roseibacterium persicicum]
MQVFAVENDLATLDLVAHFLGIAVHHNINAAPSPRLTLTVVAPSGETGTPSR